MPIESKGSFGLVICPLTKKLPEDCLERLNAHSAGKLDDVGEDAETAWVSGRHILETVINEHTSIIGGHLLINMRKAERKIPSSLLAAICRRDELDYLLAHEKSVVPRAEKKRIREDAIKKHLMKMPPVISSTTVLVDRTRDIAYIATSSLKQCDLIVEAFLRDLETEPVPLNINELMMKLYKEESGALPAIRFTDRKNGSEMDMTPGRDFLTWLWYYSETHGGELKIGDKTYCEAIEGPLVFGYSAEAQGAEESVVKKGCPQLAAEAKAALDVGKKLKKAKVLIALGKETWSFTFDADKFTFSGVNLPEGVAMDPQEIVSERAEALYMLYEAFEGYFKLFADSVTGSERAKMDKEIRAWAKDRESL